MVIVHGGFWKQKYNVDNAAIETLAPWLAQQGVVCVEVEYRRLDDGGGWPCTPQDVLAAFEHVIAKAKADARGWRRIDIENVILVGHSAGGHAALYAAHHATHKPAAVVAIAAVADLVAAHDLKLSDEGDAVALFMGGSPNELAAAYAEASPRASMLPLATPALLVTELRKTMGFILKIENFFINGKLAAQM